MHKILKHFMKTPLYSRGENRQDPLLIVYDKEDKVLKRNNELRDAGLRLQDILKVSKSTPTVEPHYLTFTQLSCHLLLARVMKGGI